jgi:diacylglycerol kinase (ATP)
MLDYIHPPHSHWVRKVKDISAGSVLIASLNAIIVGYFLFIKNNALYQLFDAQLFKISQSDWHISFFILLILLGIVILGKAFFHKGTPLRGGMPSGHSAVAFSIWTLITLISQNALVVFAVFILSFLVAQSRVGRHYHSIWEVFIGAAIGITVTLMIYRMLAG